jgi:hypothetical protein
MPQATTLGTSLGSGVELADGAMRCPEDVASGGEETGQQQQQQRRSAEAMQQYLAAPADRWRRAVLMGKVHGQCVGERASDGRTSFKICGCSINPHRRSLQPCTMSVQGPVPKQCSRALHTPPLLRL